MRNYLEYKESRTNLSIHYYLNNIFRKIEFLFFILAGVALLVTSKINQEITNNINGVFINISAPIIKFNSLPINFIIDLSTNFGDLIKANKENKLLKAENERLKFFYLKAFDIDKENKELREIFNFVSVRIAKYQAARLVGYSNQSYGNNVFIDSGAKQGVNNGDIIISKNSLIGRVIQVEEDKSRVLLITDVNFRVPIITYESNMRGVLAGNNSGLMEILYLNKNHNIKIGDMVFTSGDGDLVPPGLLVGIVEKVSDNYVGVKMAEDINRINIVAIAKY